MNKNDYWEIPGNPSIYRGFPGISGYENVKHIYS